MHGTGRKEPPSCLAFSTESLPSPSPSPSPGHVVTGRERAVSSRDQLAFMYSNNVITPPEEYPATQTRAALSAVMIADIVDGSVEAAASVLSTPSSAVFLDEAFDDQRQNDEDDDKSEHLNFGKSILRKMVPSRLRRGLKRRMSAPIPTVTSAPVLVVNTNAAAGDGYFDPAMASNTNLETGKFVPSETASPIESSPAVVVVVAASAPGTPATPVTPISTPGVVSGNTSPGVLAAASAMTAVLSSSPPIPPSPRVSSRPVEIATPLWPAPIVSQEEEVKMVVQSLHERLGQDSVDESERVREDMYSQMVAEDQAFEATEIRLGQSGWTSESELAAIRENREAARRKWQLAIAEMDCT
ncbi:hypothetical protein V1512DRAFT_262373 [Lipomyces arxii]|uniref:uncharacterized protein n=1 Tax=Lipomyces arxii TaxID=56418 RepID=UPI0034CE34F3